MKIVTISIKDDEEEMLELFKQISQKDTRNFSEAVKKAIQEYIDKHAKSENQPTLKLWQDDELKDVLRNAVPSILHSNRVWREACAKADDKALADWIKALKECLLICEQERFKRQIEADREK